MTRYTCPKRDCRLTFEISGAVLDDLCCPRCKHSIDAADGEEVVDARSRPELIVAGTALATLALVLVVWAVLGVILRAAGLLR
jgi:hypothetical protein